MTFSSSYRHSKIFHLNYMAHPSVAVKLQLPPDGNLYHFSVKKMAAFFNELRIDDSTVQTCIRSRMDGKKFSRLSEADLNNYGILNPITGYFRSKTGKRSPKFMLWWHHWGQDGWQPLVVCVSSTIEHWQFLVPRQKDKLNWSVPCWWLYHLHIVVTSVLTTW